MYVKWKLAPSNHLHSQPFTVNTQQHMVMYTHFIVYIYSILQFTIFESVGKSFRFEQFIKKFEKNACD